MLFILFFKSLIKCDWLFSSLQSPKWKTCVPFFPFILEILRQWLCSWKLKVKSACTFLLWSRWHNIFPVQRIKTYMFTFHFRILSPSFWGLIASSLCSQRMVEVSNCYFWVMSVSSVSLFSTCLCIVSVPYRKFSRFK